SSFAALCRLWMTDSRKLRLLNFAIRRPRQCIDEHVALRQFEFRDARAEVGVELLFVCLAHDEGDRYLAPGFIGDRNYRGVGDARVRDEHRLNLGGIDVYAAADEHLFLSAGDVEEAFVI